MTKDEQIKLLREAAKALVAVRNTPTTDERLDLLVDGLEEALSATEQPGEIDHDRVTLPVHEDEAAMMVLLGTDWLERNAPHRLRRPEPQPSTLTEEEKQEAIEVMKKAYYRAIVGESNGIFPVKNVIGRLGAALIALLERFELRRRP